MPDDTHNPVPEPPSSTAPTAAQPNGHQNGAARESLLDRLKTLLGLKSNASLREDLKEALADNQPNSAFSPQERTMLENVLGFRELRVADVMVPRADIIAVAFDTSLAELLRVFRTASHSRLPVYGETLDDPKGMLHIRDFLDFLAARADAGAARRKRRNDKETTAFDLGNVDLALTLASTKLLRPVLYAPPSMPALDLLVRMQATRTHIALVIDEYGGTDGLVSIEDLVEMIVGDIEDEHDETGVAIQPASGGYLMIEARASLEEVSEVLGTDLELDDAAEDVDTIGGYLATIAGRVPSRGELIATPNGIEFEVMDADPRRIKRVRVQKTASEETTPLLAAPKASTDAEDHNTTASDGSAHKAA
ncbi:MAG: hemolysin family protein [Beijerinckiaceae bacterium]|nr:hemolysin family protein [Beijerinckiaceae bacterium]